MSLNNFVLGFVVGAIPTAIVGSIILLVLSLRPTILPPLYVDENGVFRMDYQLFGLTKEELSETLGVIPPLQYWGYSRVSLDYCDYKAENGRMYAMDEVRKYACS